MRSRKAYIPAGYLGTKRMGELAELGFMYRAATYGIGVAKPFGDSFPYDCVTQHGKRVLRVQVKSCFSEERRNYTGFPIIVACHWGQGKMNYSVDDVDFIAAFIAKYDAWYLIPMESLGTRKNIRVYPGKTKAQNRRRVRKVQRGLESFIRRSLQRKTTLHLSRTLPDVSSQPAVKSERAHVSPPCEM